MKLLTGRPLTYWIWPAAALLMLFICIVMTALLFSGGAMRAQRAMEGGQRLIVTLKDGAIEGLPLMTEPVPATEAPPAQLPPPMENALPGDFSTAPPEATVTPPLPQPPEGNDPAGNPSAAIPAPAAPPAISPEAAVVPAPSPAPSPALQPETVTPAPPAQTAQTAIAAPVSPVSRSAPPENPFISVRKSAGKPLPVAPIATLTEKLPDGAQLPKIGEDGTRPWDAYGKPFAATDKPMIAVIVTGLGLGRYTTDAAFSLPENFTFSFSPYAREVELWGNHARNTGHETMLDLPVQPADYPATDPGPYGLLNSLKPEENKERLRWVMARFPGYTGFLMPRNPVVPQAVMLTALAEIGGRGLLLVDVAGMAAEAMNPSKVEMGVIDLTADVTVDEELNEAAINAQLEALVKTAKQRGYAIALARPYPMTVDALIAWSKTLAQQGVVLAPVSAIARKLG